MPWSVIACAIGSEIGKKNKPINKQSKDKSRFNRTDFPFDKESRRDSQFKFFGYKPKRFISVYAKKPKIRVKVKVKSENTTGCNKPTNSLDALLQQGISRNGLAYIRSAQFQAQQSQLQMMGQAQMASCGYGLGGALGGALGGLGLGLDRAAARGVY